MIEKGNKYYILDGQINSESCHKLIDFINTNEGRLVIAINSTGGELSHSEFILRALNDNADRISLVAIERINSCAFSLFYEFNGARSMITPVHGMHHYGYRDITINDDGRPSYASDKITKRQVVFYKKRSIDFAKKFMTKKELRELKRGWDVYFDFDRMKEIFPDAIIL